MAYNDCPICTLKNTNVFFHVYNGEYGASIECPICGTYEISGVEFNRRIFNKKKDTLLSFCIRQRGKQGELVYVTSDNRNSIMNGIYVPNSVRDIAELILKEVYTSEELLANGLLITLDNISTFAIESMKKLLPVLQYLEDAGWVKLKRASEGVVFLSLTGEGIAVAEDIISIKHSSTQVFIAMSFNPELDSIYHLAIEKAVEECGLNPIRIDLVDFNDEIIANVLYRINQSRFLIADYTENRPGVYFETGYAIGKGLPVIYCCRESDKGHIHFDVNHYKFIHWIEVGDFKTELVKRITNTGLSI